MEAVDKDSVKLDIDKGILTFKAKKGQSLDPHMLLDAIKRTSFHSKLNYLEVKVVGDVAIGKNETVLKMAGGMQQFLLVPDSDVTTDAAGSIPFQQLKEAASRGQKIICVIGRVKGWGGDFRRGKRPEATPMMNPTDQKGMHLLIVTGFETN